MPIERILISIAVIVGLVLAVRYFSGRFHQAEDSDRQFREDIAEVIASYTPFPAREILEAYDESGSWDKVIAACLSAGQSGESLNAALLKVWRP